MQLVTSEWLSERGGLHDARVLGARWNGPNIEVAVDDEWANERGLSFGQGQAAGTLVLEDPLTTTVDLSSVVGGWISEVSILGSAVQLAFCDRDPLSFRVKAASWRSG